MPQVILMKYGYSTVINLTIVTENLMPVEVYWTPQQFRDDCNPRTIGPKEWTRPQIESFVRKHKLSKMDADTLKQDRQAARVLFGGDQN
jgi:hypothetical protein